MCSLGILRSVHVPQGNSHSETDMEARHGTLLRGCTPDVCLHYLKPHDHFMITHMITSMNTEYIREYIS